jgi:hypothetical protein
MTRRFALVLACAAAAALVPAASAAAALPFTAGSGTGHDIAVGSDGAAHVTWIEDRADDVVRYCRVPAGGSACEVMHDLQFPGTESIGLGSTQVVAPEPGSVVVYAGCTQCETTAEFAMGWLSHANGTSFFSSTGTFVGRMRLGGQGGHIGDGELLGVNGGLFQAMQSPAEPINLGAGGFVYSPSAVPGAVDEAVWAANDLATVRYRVFNGALDPGSLNDETTAPNWSGSLTLPAPEPDNKETHLSSSAGNGVLLSYLSTFSPGDARIGLRKFDSTTDTFGAPVYVQGGSAIDDNGLDYPHHSQDAGGRIHFVWRTLHDGGRLRYTRSDDGGASFSAPDNLAARETFLDPLVEAGPAGTGFAAWRTTGGDIRVVPIDPQFEADPVPSGPRGPDVPGGTDTTDPTVGGFSAGSRTLAPGAGTTFRFTASEAGRAVLSFHKRVKGLKVKQRGRRRCVPQTRQRLRKLRRSAGSPAAYRRLLRQRRCKAWKKVGEIRREVLAGRKEIIWNGRVAGRRLSPGQYESRLVIRDAAGNPSRTERLRFRVQRRR